MFVFMLYSTSRLWRVTSPVWLLFQLLIHNHCLHQSLVDLLVNRCLLLQRVEVKFVILVALI